MSADEQLARVALQPASTISTGGRTMTMTDNTEPLPSEPLDPPAQDEVEAVARLVEPYAWHWFDLSAKCYTENRGGKGQEGFYYETTYRAGCRTVEAYREWWEIAEPPHVSLHMAHWRESFVKARSILTALRQHQTAEITRLRTELAEAHQRGVKAGLDAWNHWYDRATADDDCEYLNGEGWDDAAKLRAIDPASVATPDA